MTSDRGRLIIRPARAADKERVLAFCQGTWDWGDYIAYVWDDWLSSPRGRLLVGEIDGEPVAVCRAALPTPSEGWLEGLRVDPSRRGAGIGLEMSRACLAAALDLGASVVRFATRSDNHPIHRIASELGYTRVASYVLASASPDPGDGPPSIELSASGAATAGVGLVGSETYRQTAGLVWEGWSCRKLTLEELDHRRSADEVFVLPADSPAALAVARIDVREVALEIDYLGEVGPWRESTDESIVHLALGLRGLAASRGLARIEAKIPELERVLSAIRRAGFEQTSDFGALWVFQHP